MIFNISKPIRSTSFSNFKEVRNITNEKVGYGSSLELFAEGVLVVCTGKNKKDSAKITNYDKACVATIQLVDSTKILDPKGIINRKKQVPILNKEIVEHTLKSSLGETLQTLPMYSSKKIMVKS